MSDEEQLDIQSDDSTEELITDKESNADILSVKTVQKKQIHYRAPLIIAACIFLAALIGFGVWKCFFDTSLEGTWGIDIAAEDKSDNVKFNLTFSDDNTARFHSGGVVYVGRYELTNDKEHGDVINVYIPVYGQVQLFKFNYSFDGNIFTGRNLDLTDLSGMFLSPDDSSSEDEEVKSKKKTTDSVDINGTTYYKWKFISSSEGYKISKNNDFKKDKKIIGSWLYKNDDLSYAYTMTFNDDGTFEQLAPDLEIHGTYTVKDGVCYTKFYSIGNSLSEQSFDYKVDGDKFTLEQNEFVKTNDKYAYISENN